MKRNQTLRLTLSAVLCAVAVVGSTLSFPVGSTLFYHIFFGVSTKVSPRC